MKKALAGLLFLGLAILAQASEPQITPEKAMGGAENLRLVLAAKIISVEKVTCGRDVNDWEWGMPLHVEKGPVTVPSDLAMRIKKFLQEPFPVWGDPVGLSYHPCYRVILEEKGHVLQILVIDGIYTFNVYRDGVRIGCHDGDMRIVERFEALLAKPEPGHEQKPSQI